MAVMSTLIVGAGAAGGYLGAQLVDAGRDVTFLVHPGTRARLAADGLKIRRGADVTTTAVHTVTAAGVDTGYDVIVMAVRTDGVESAARDLGAAVTAATRIVPLMNGMRHLSLLTAAFGQDRVLGAATRLVTSLLPDGTINVAMPGIEMEIGQLDGADSAELDRVVADLSVPNIAVSVRRDIIAAMWEKFAFITSTAVLTCLVGEEVGTVVRADGGIALARNVLDEVASIAAADGSPLAEPVRTGLAAILTDPRSAFGPSMFRDMAAGRPIEITVLADLADRARAHQISTPLLDASLVRIDVHNRQVRAAD
jgi:2-dehydropantoate 2-reductase